VCASGGYKRPTWLLYIPRTDQAVGGPGLWHVKNSDQVLYMSRVRALGYDISGRRQRYIPGIPGLMGEEEYIRKYEK